MLFYALIYYLFIYLCIFGEVTSVVLFDVAYLLCIYLFICSLNQCVSFIRSDYQGNVMHSPSKLPCRLVLRAISQFPVYERILSASSGESIPLRKLYLLFESAWYIQSLATV